MARQRTSAREIKRLKRRKEVYNLRVAGHNIHAIAERLQIGEATVKRDVKILMAAARDKMADRCQSELMLSLERLDQYQASFHEKAKTGDREAAEVCLKVEAQRARLLYPTTGNATAVNVNVDRPNNLPDAERTGIVVEFHSPDPKLHADNPMPTGPYNPRPISKSEMDDARRVTHPHLVEHEQKSPKRRIWVTPIIGQPYWREE